MSRRRPPVSRRSTPAQRARDGARISGPVELIQAVPYLVGFHPFASLVLVGLAGGSLVVTARLDLADVDPPGGQAESADGSGAGGVDGDGRAAARAVIDHTLQAIVRGGADTVTALIFEDLSARCPGVAVDRTILLGQLTDTAAACGCAVRDVIQVATGRWRSLICRDPRCCPAGGADVPDTTSDFAAAAIIDGIAPLRDREGLRAIFEPVSAQRSAALVPLLDAAQAASDATPHGARAGRHRTAVRSLFALARAGVPQQGDAGQARRADDERLAAAAVALRSIPVRDAVWMGVDDGRLGNRDWWLHMARQLPAPYDAAPLFLYAWAAWRAGDGAAASMATERVLASDPGYSAADLLHAALSGAVDPRRMPRLKLPRTA